MRASTTQRAEARNERAGQFSCDQTQRGTYPLTVDTNVSAPQSHRGSKGKRKGPKHRIHSGARLSPIAGVSEYTNKNQKKRIAVRRFSEVLKRWAKDADRVMPSSSSVVRARANGGRDEGTTSSPARNPQSEGADRQTARIGVARLLSRPYQVCCSYSKKVPLKDGRLHLDHTR